MKNPPLPRRLRVIVALFAVLGTLAIVHMIEMLFVRRIEINFMALLLPIGIGLARRHAFAYRCALASSGIVIALSALLLVAIPWLNADVWFNGHHTTSENAKWISALGTLLIATFALTVYRALRRDDVKQIYGDMVI